MKQDVKKFSFKELAEHRHKSVAQVISESIEQCLDRSNWNDTNEISRFLGTVDVLPGNVNQSFPLLQELMQRRHQIVHRADRVDAQGQGNHRAAAINPELLGAWIGAVELFSADIMRELVD